MNKEIDLSVSCYGSVKDLSYDVAILPWGATEPHNYHLPYLTDCILSHRTSVDAAEIFIPKLIAEGYQLVTIHELARIKGTELQTGIAYGDFTDQDQ